MNAIEQAGQALPAAEHVPQDVAAAGASTGDHVIIDIRPGSAHGAPVQPLGEDVIEPAPHGPASLLAAAEHATEHTTEQATEHTTEQATGHPATGFDVDLEAARPPGGRVGWAEHLTKNVFGAAAGQATQQLYWRNLAQTAVNLVTTPKAIGQGVGAGLGLGAASLVTEAPQDGAGYGRLATTVGMGFIGVGANGANDTIKAETVPKWMPDAIKPDMSNPTAEAVATGTKWFLNAGTSAILGAGINRATPK